MFSIIYIGITMGIATVYLKNIKKAKEAKNKIFKILS